MASITSWTRLEPRTRNVEMSTALQARVYDPLWLLTRQWQMGEFQGEDNGAPVMARWRAESSPLTRYHAGLLAPDSDIIGQPYDSHTVPLETLVEREQIRPNPPAGNTAQLRFAVTAGLHFLRLLDEQPLAQTYRELFRNQYPFAPPPTEQLDDDSRSFFELTAARVPDGRELYHALHRALRPTGGARGQLPAGLPIAAADVAEVEKAALIWLQWCDALFSEPAGPNPAWSAERLEYSFSVSARLSEHEQPLTAQEYYDGHLDWYSFDANFAVALRAREDAPPAAIVRTTIPAPVTYPGMPASRFWEFEDAQVDFGQVAAGPEDLARLLFVEFALTYGNDWFVIPLELEVGSLCRTKSLVITDTFGVRTLLRPAGGTRDSWRMFQLATLRGQGLPPVANLFFLPPTLLRSLESQPLEEIRLLRDEMANLAWAVERVIESAAERPQRRFERDAAAPPPVPSAPAADLLVYRLATEVPDYWIPLLPVQTNDGLRLRRGATLKPDGSRQIARATGRILQSDQSSLEICEEELPREGLNVTRHYQHTRWLDGTTHLWLARRKRVGRGEGSSGLRFDATDAD